MFQRERAIESKQTLRRGKGARVGDFDTVSDKQKLKVIFRPENV